MRVRLRLWGSCLVAVTVALALVAGGGGGGSPVPAATASAAPSPSAAAAMSRYSVANGCYALISSVSGAPLAAAAGPFRLQATALGQYLLYTPDRTFLADASTGATEPNPSASTVWQLDGPPFRLVDLGTGASVPVSFAPAGGCAVYPEAQVNATGTTFRGASPTSIVQGTIDAHTHITAFDFIGGDFHCGKPWDPFGAPYALPDCRQYEQGTNGQVEAFLDFGTPASRPSDMVGWPTFHNWPGPDRLIEEGDYYTGIKRAWMAGVRVIVTQLVDNEALCQLMTTRRNPCVDQQAVDIQWRDLHELQDYIDAQSGGPGRGFFRIVTNPFQARQVISSGKLAVVMGIEASHTFNCGNFGQGPCTQQFVDSQLDHFKQLGIATFFPVHKFDNAFGGAKMDGGTTGVIINLGNRETSGHFFDVKTCTGAESDNTQITEPTTGTFAALANGALAPLTGGAVVPDYPPPPHCNQLGLTAIGTYLIDQMIKRHFIVELDHMDAKTADEALSIIVSHGYSGVISAHSWDSPQENSAIYKVGGFVTPITGSPKGFITDWKASRLIRNGRFYSGTGYGYGADMNGLHAESGPIANDPITYPFKSFDGNVTFDREVWGERTFDINRDGVANYGMFADWMNSVQRIAGPTIVADMFRGAEAYLEMWERAFGVPVSGCRYRHGSFGVSGTRDLRLGVGSTSVLYALGQPSDRPGWSYRYCVAGAPGRTVSGVFTAAGRVGLWVTDAPGYVTSVGGIRPGVPAARVARVAARSLGGGLWLGRGMSRGSRYVFRVRGGRVAVVGVAARSVARSDGAVRAAVRASGL